MVQALERELPLAERSYLAIKRMIVRNELAPGQQVTATALAETLQISRSPLKSALARLVQDNLIEIDGRMDTRVAPIDAKYVHDVYELRVVLELECARLSLSAIDRTTVDALRERFANLGSGNNTVTDQDFDAIEGGMHRLLVDRCGNDIIKSTIDGLRSHWDRIHNWLAEDMAEHRAEHVREALTILDAIADGDLERAVEELRRHLNGVGEQFLRALEQRQGPRDSRG